MPTQKEIKSFYDIRGFFWWLDRHVFAHLLRAQDGTPPGVLVELGTYMGKSAVIIGNHLHEGDRFVALDLFGRNDLLGETERDEANRQENNKSYKTLSRQQFESNYLALHKELPEIVEGLSSEIMNHVEPGTARFVHVDASHLYPFVRVDVENTKTMLRPNGLAVFDDYRSEHTPGVSAAVWEAVFKDGLIPFAVTPQKLYGVYGDPESYLSALRAFVEKDKRFWAEEEEILGRAVLRIGQRNKGAKTKLAEGISDSDADKIAEKLSSRIYTGLSAQLAAVVEQASESERKREVGDAEKVEIAPASSAGSQKETGVHGGDRRAPASRNRGKRPTSLHGRVMRKVAREYAPPALTRWVLSRRDGRQR